ncbi:hypothetical protein Tco_0746847, partial [Tanacetum coccineum]
LPSKLKLILEGVFYVAWWHIWVFRNHSIFDEVPPRRSVLFDDIVSRSFTCETESEKQDTSSRSRNDVDADNADIRPIYDEVTMVEVQLTTECNIFATRQQHTEQPEIITKGRVDQYTEQCQVKSHMLDSLLDNKDIMNFQVQSSRTESGKQDTSSRSGNDADADNADIRPIYDEEPMTEVQLTVECNIFATRQQHTEQPEIITEGRVDQYTEQCQVKSHMLDSPLDNKTTEFSSQSLESKTIEQTTSLLATNADLKAQIQEKVFAIDALKNDLRKLKGNIVRQPNAFKSERPQMSKPWFASQVDVNHNLLRPVTQHYLPKRSESVFSKHNHMIASSSSRNSSKNMPRLSSNDMVHNHYLDKARKKTQERDRNLKTSVMPSARFQSTVDDRKPKSRNTNHSTRSLHVSKSSCVTITVVPIANHSKNSNSFSDTKHFIQSNKTKNSNKPVEQKCHTQKPVRLFTGHRFSPNKTYVVYEETSPISDLRWKPTGRIFKTVGLRWVATGKILISCTSKDDSEPTHGSNVDIPNIHEFKKTLDLSASTSINVQKEQSFNLSAGTSNNVKLDKFKVWSLRRLISHKPVLKWIHN